MIFRKSEEVASVQLFSR